MDENKKRALAAALSQIDKQFGKGSVMRMGDRQVEQVEQGIPLVPLQTGRGVKWRAQPPLDPERSAPRGASPE